MTRYFLRIGAGTVLAAVGVMCYRYNPLAAVIFYGWIIGAMNERLTVEINDLKREKH